MARVGGLRAMFTRRAVADHIENWMEEIDNKILLSLQYAGEQFVNIARLGGTYDDDTGNLRSSIGYIILKDGEVVHQNFQKQQGAEDGDTGVLKAYSAANEVAGANSQGWVLIGVAGMEYAAAVEAKNYDVITGAYMKTEAILKRVLEIGRAHV